jgi:hypothetical protein
MIQTQDWMLVSAELLEFATFLCDPFVFDWSADELLYFFSKPWKWEREHADWVAAGRPVEPGGEEGKALLARWLAEGRV